jgi:hypothetical protein
MKPQLISQDYGLHNRDPLESAARILKGGSWKKQRVVVIIPAGDTMPTKAALAMRGLFFPPNQACHWIGALGMEVGDAYSNAIEAIVNHPELNQWEYLLTLEHDNIPPADGVIKLIERMEQHPEFACIGGLYWTKGEGGVPQIWGDPRDPVLNFRPQPPVPGQLVECCGTGMGFNLWRLSMFRDARLARPWFRTLCSKEGVGTQDLSFWTDARKNGYRCAIDCSVLVGHYDVGSDICW